MYHIAVLVAHSAIDNGFQKSEGSCLRREIHPPACFRAGKRMAGDRGNGEMRYTTCHADSFRLNPFGVAMLLVILAGGCVQERCYEDYHCDPPKVCSPEGACIFECTGPYDCINGFVCEDHRCVPDQTAHDVLSDSGETAPWCPAGMLMIEGAFCIDVYEAARPDATPSNPGRDESRAVARKGVYPWMTTDNAVARSACEASGKRLCRPVEWKLACTGPDESVYSYGNLYEPQTCNGIDAFGRTSFHLAPTGSFPDCTNEYGVFDMNGNLWEHVAGGTAMDVRGGAYNCGDSAALHKCAYIPGTWKPSAQGFRCCRDPLFGGGDHVEESVVDRDVPVVTDEASQDLPTVPDDSELPGQDVHAGDACGPPDSSLDQGFLDNVVDDQGPSDSVADAVHYGCAIDMALVSYPGKTPFCMDRYEASRADSTSTSYGSSTIPVSEPGRMPWMSGSVSAVSAAESCQSAGKRLCRLDEWHDACVGSDDTVYSYGDAYDPSVCNSIDTFCYCDTTCAAIESCPYPHCRVQASPAGDGGPCGAAFKVMPTGSFPSCVNEWGVFDVNGNVWEVVDAADSLDHFRGGGYNCADSEALHRCDHDGTWGPSARGFRCCADATVTATGE